MRETIKQAGKHKHRVKQMIKNRTNKGTQDKDQKEINLV